MQAAGNLVSSSAELAAGVQDGQADLHRRAPDLGMDAHGEAAAVVLHGAGAVLVERDDDLIAEARQGLVHRIIDDLVDQMVQTALIR